MTQPPLDQKVIAIIAERSPMGIIEAATQVMNAGQADVLKLRLDCLDPEYLNERTISSLKMGLPNYHLMASIRNLNSVPEKRTELEGYKGGKHDLDRIALLRKAAEEGMQYFELEHELRRNFFLLGRNPTQVVILYGNQNMTPDLPKLKEIYNKYESNL